MSPYRSSRVIHFWYLLTWTILLSFTIIIYHAVTESSRFQIAPGTLTLIDRGYICVRWFFIIAIIANIVSLIFREIKTNFWSEHLAIRKFLPTVRFTVITLIWAVWLFFILDAIDINTTGLLTGAGIGWAIFVLASKDIIANLLGSISIIMSKTFEIGETIRIKWVEGIVEEISLSYTKIMSTEGKLIYMPNKILNSEQLENLTRRRFFSYVYYIPFKKAWGDPKTIKETLKIIEEKIDRYSPIEVKIRTEFPNQLDCAYVFTINLPEENLEFEREIREFLIPYIFIKD